MKNLAYIFLVIVLCQCGYFDPTNPVPPHMKWMEKGPKPSPDGKPFDPLYVEGWQHGCHTGIAAVSNSWYQFYYQFKQDSEKAQNAVYYKGWKDSFNYCQRYMYQWHSRIGF